MSEPDAGLTELFRDEAIQRLDQMDMSLLAIEAGGAGVETVDALFRAAHTIKGAAGMLGFDDLRALAHAAEDVLTEVRDAGMFPPELAALLLRATTALRAQVAGAAEPIDDLLRDLAASQPMLGDRAVRGASEAGTQTAAPDVARLPATAPTEVRSAPWPAAGLGHALRVPAEKIDHLVDVAGEIMQDRRRLAHSLGAEQRLSHEVADVLGAGERLLDDLKDTAVGMRTLPLAVIAGPLPRAVRDLARAAGKDVDFVVTGADTELDRVILQSLSEPLVHLLRNAVVHGVEAPAERQLAGKPPRGRVELRAVPRGSRVEIVVTDDGMGVAPEVIERARREGSLADLLTKAGYTTAERVTDLAGRGVGLDAVRTYVRSVGGSLELRSEPGNGLEVVLLLPLALALLDVLLFERGGAVYGVPLTAVEEVLTVTRTLTLQGRGVLEVRGRSLPVTDFAALVGTGAPPLGHRTPALVIGVGGRRAVASCDTLLGQEEVVIKSLGPFLTGVEGYLGATILADGRIALLVEPTVLTRGTRHLPGMTVPAGPAGSVSVASQNAAGSATAVGYAAAVGQAAAPKVLVVEDSFTVRELQRGILEAAGYPVATARDGRDALGALDSDSEIALVITDLEMPELDGIELTRAIRADTARSSLPVVIVTSHGSEDDRRRGMQAGADAYMSKGNFDQQALLATVERLVGR